MRDRYVLRLIAVDRLIHFVVLSVLAAALFLFATNKAALNADFARILKDLQGGVGGPVNDSNRGIVFDLRRLFAVSLANLYTWRERRSPPMTYWKAPRRSGCGKAAGGLNT